MSPISIPRLTFRTFLIYCVIAASLVVLGIYVLFQARFLIEGPQISTIALSPVQTERLITIEGDARNIVRMTLNGRQIFTDKNGTFKEALVLENGYTVATLQAEDRYGRVTSHTQTFVYADQSSAEVVSN